MSNGGTNPAPIEDEPIIFSIVEVTEWLGPETLGALAGSPKWEQFKAVFPEVVQMLREIKAKHQPKWSEQTIKRAATMLTVGYLRLGVDQPPSVDLVERNLEDIYLYLKHA